MKQSRNPNAPSENAQRQSTTTVKSFYQTTVGLRLAAILETGVVLVARTGVPHGVKPAVWFTKNQDWDATANKSMQMRDGSIYEMNKEETDENGQGLVRIGVLPEAAPHDWNDYKKMSGDNQRMLKGLYNLAVARGVKPSDWRVSFDPVPREKWQAIEVWKDGKWVPHSLEGT